MVEIQKFNTTDTVKSLGLMIDLPAIGFCAICEGRIVASFGLAWGNGRCWLWYYTEELQTRHKHVVRRQAARLKRMARQLGHDELFVVRDQQWETSARLVKLMGFELLEVIDGQEVHVCKLKDSE
ncbi:hypothetical protein GOZ96_04720 [Agrobacterium vitis]|uniref:GNAT family N-acetyltransferase n=1 Tax=Agrobacterium vitis TaxID=373 RepID=A0A7J4X4J3_AGRVI|nr:hypothetical protein [Agrobacterium vitis]KAA3527047.1 hypothetical protein DXT89_14020 [Agrobacterium vitis]MUZ95892.1 hypothetical protein [Agrobacterium vitis]